AASPRWADAVRSSGLVSLGLPAAAEPDPGWAGAWWAASTAVGSAVDALLDSAPVLTAARLARDVVAALPTGALFVLGSST
ncbi:hypothetical protein, partial [Enterococcus faecalis]